MNVKLKKKFLHWNMLSHAYVASPTHDATVNCIVSFYFS
jgi:hypothetical protein